MTEIKINSEDPETQSANLFKENIDLLQTLFPDLITEGEEGTLVNVDVLKDLIGDFTTSDCEEKFGLNWYGKRQARRIALTPSTGTLRPSHERMIFETLLGFFLFRHREPLL